MQKDKWISRNPYFTRFCCAMQSLFRGLDSHQVCRNPYFTRFCCAITEAGWSCKGYKCRNPYFTRFCCAILENTFDKIAKEWVAILILLDSVVQFRMWFIILWIEICRNPYFTRFCCAIKLNGGDNVIQYMSQSLFY